MEQTEYNHLPIIPKEAKEFNKEFPTSKPKTNKKNIVIAVLLISLCISIGYIITELPGKDVEVVRNESLILGFNRGVGYWNNEVIINATGNGTIPRGVYPFALIPLISIA